MPCCKTLFFLFFFAAGASAQAFGDAMNAVFALQSGAGPVSAHLASQRRVEGLMRRQGIPQDAAELRTLPDAQLLRLAQLAAVAGVSRWKRDDATNAILLTDGGEMMHPFSPGAVESDVMVCVICALLTVIAIHHHVLDEASKKKAPSGVVVGGGALPK